MATFGGKINSFGIALLSLALAATASPVFAQATDNDWEWSEDTNGTRIASVSYGSGQTIIAHCHTNRFTLLVTGVPSATEGQTFNGAVVSPSNNQDVQVWNVIEGNALRSDLPGRDARYLRKGQKLTLTSVQGDQTTPVRVDLELPTQHANLDRILSECGYVVETERDLLPRADRDPLLRPREYASSPELHAGRGLEVSCIVSGGRYSDCVLERNVPGQNLRNTTPEVARRNNKRIDEARASANEGRVAYISIPRLIMVRR